MEIDWYETELTYCLPKLFLSASDFNIGNQKTDKMSKEADTGVGLVVIEDEQKRDEGKVTKVQGQSSPVVDHSTVMMTSNEFSDGTKPISEIWENESVPIEDPVSSLLESFQSPQSSQSSEGEK